MYFNVMQMNDKISKSIAILLLEYEEGNLNKSMDLCVEIRTAIQEEQFDKLYIEKGG